MRVSKLFAAVAAASLVATPVLAQSGTRVGASVKAASALQDEAVEGEGTGAGGLVIAVAAAVAVGLGIYLVADGGDDDDDLPTSP